MATETDQLDRYVNRGPRRGADSVLDAARRDVERGGVATTDLAGGRRGPRLAVAAAVVVLIGVGLVALASRTDPTSELNVADPASPTAQPTPEQLAEMNQRLAEQQANGWVPYGYAEPDGAARSGWVRWNDGPVYDPDNASRLPRSAVYDEIDGTVVGYAYPDLGFVDEATASQPDFDPEALRIARYGCDPGTGGPQTPEQQECIRQNHERWEQEAADQGR